MRTGTAKELGLPAQQLGHMRRRGDAEIVGVHYNRKAHSRAYIWRIDEPAEPRTIGAGLKMLRQLAGLSQQQVCDLCDFDQTSLADIERGKAEPRVHSLARLLRFYGVRFAEFFALIGNDPPPNRLPREGDLSIPDALLTVRAKLGMPKSASVSWPRTIRKQCARNNVAWLAFWQYLDAHLEPRGL
jgi:transcriptional regulator with XRE-family HTH domain